MDGMKLRLLLMGIIISILGTALLATRALHELQGGILLAVGIMLLAAGLLWKNREAKTTAGL